MCNNFRLIISDHITYKLYWRDNIQLFIVSFHTTISLRFSHLVVGAWPPLLLANFQGQLNFSIFKTYTKNRRRPGSCSEIQIRTRVWNVVLRVRFMTKRNQMMSSNRRIISPDLEPDSQNIYYPVEFSALSMSIHNYWWQVCVCSAGILNKEIDFLKMGQCKDDIWQ